MQNSEQLNFSDEALTPILASTGLDLLSVTNVVSRLV